MDIKILDDEIRNIGTEIKNTGEKLEAIFKRYEKCMNKLGTEGIKSGDTSKNIISYVNAIKLLDNAVKSNTQQICKKCFAYIDAIDTADDFLF